MSRRAILAAAVCLLTSAATAFEPLHPQAVEARSGVVVSDSADASRVGLEVLREGGNAVDAAVATALAMAVTFPEAGNVGGGGFMMICPPGGTPVCVEYRETAPAAAQRDTFVERTDMYGHPTVGVPGTVRGLALAHRRFGRRRWADLVRPAERLAREGFEVDRRLADSLNALRAEAVDYTELQRVFRPPNGSAWRTGDRLTQPDLAVTLELLAQDGPDAFYRGAIAELIVEEMRAGGGMITADDLAAYQARLRRPVHGTFGGCDVFGPPPPSSGGICLVQMLNILECFPLKAQGRLSAATVHQQIETMRRAYRDRARWLGDDTVTPIPAHLTDKRYARHLAAQIRPDRATPSDRVAGDIPLAEEGSSTTHFSIVDTDAMVVSNTYTLEQPYGSRVVVRGGGFLLNNEMGDFNWRPGVTNRAGRIGTPANEMAPGKRMLSSQTPVIVMRDGRPLLATGSPGARTIINTVLGTVLDIVEFDMDLPDAVAAPRLHHSWFPDAARFEGLDRPEHNALIGALRRMGHRFDEPAEPQGAANSILIHDGRYLGVADPRRTGLAVGY